jgi:cell surface protein SprA
MDSFVALLLAQLASGKHSMLRALPYFLRQSLAVILGCGVTSCFLIAGEVFCAELAGEAFPPSIVYSFSTALAPYGMKSLWLGRDFTGLPECVQSNDYFASLTEYTAQQFPVLAGFCALQQSFLHNQWDIDVPHLMAASASRYLSNELGAMASDKLNVFNVLESSSVDGLAADSLPADSLSTDSLSVTLQAPQDDDPVARRVTALRRALLVGDSTVRLAGLRDSLRLDSLNLRALRVGVPIPRSNAFSRFFASGYEHSVSVDTTLTNTPYLVVPEGMKRPVFMRLREAFYGSELQPAQSLPLDEYLKLRTAYIAQSLQDSTLRSYEIKRRSRLEWSNILNQAANFGIPIPQNPITGIFGKPEIKLNINAEYNFRVGARVDVQNLGTTSAFGQVQVSPMFSQDIQANLGVQIGDKLSIALDQNTRRNFDFENLSNIAFDGDPDDIIRRVEVGNVQLATPSVFISGGQSAFGLRTDFQFGPLYLRTIAAQRRGQRRSVSLQGGVIKQGFQLRAYDYADNHFFVDTAYKSLFRAAYAQLAPTVPQGGAELFVKEIEVWESTTDLSDVRGVSEAVAFSTLPPVRYTAGASGQYPVSFRDSAIRAGDIERGRFKRLEEGKGYVYNSALGWLTITSLRRDRYYAIAYRVEGRTPQSEDDIVYGTLTSVDTNSVRILKLIYRPNMQPGFRNLWARQMQNIYNIGASNVSLADTKINIWYLRQNNDSSDVLPNIPDKIVTILGVDRVNNGSGAAPPDGQFDLSVAGGAQSLVFRADIGAIIFPSLQPFREGLRSYFAARGNPQEAEPYIFSAVYDTTREVARLDAQHDRFVISGEVSGAASNGRFPIPNAFNLAPNSIRVTLNGAPLQEYTDYRIDYGIGLLTITNQNALQPNARLEIEYEQNDPFNIATRTTFGVRGDLDTKALFRSRTLESTLGFTFMTFSQDLIVDRVRIGEELVRNAMAGVDGSFKLNAPWLTRALDALPFTDTKAPSSITGRGEIALMMPTPNTRLSPIPSDRGSSVAYIDDFEAGQRPLLFSIQPDLWSYASPPRDEVVGGVSPFTAPDQNDSAATLFRGGLNWFRFSNPETLAADVYPNRQTSYINRNINTMFVEFNPDKRGVYNRNPLYQDRTTYLFNPERGADTIARRLAFVRDSTARALYSQRPEIRNRTWGGFMRILSSFNTNFDTDNVEYIEIVMRINAIDPTTRMYIDLGQISEDVIPNKVLNTEDGITEVNPTPNGIIGQGEEAEDVGIDMLSNAQERGLAALPASLRRLQRGIPGIRDSLIINGADTTRALFAGYPSPLNLEPDPARDDFSFNFNFNSATAINQQPADFEFYNGLENNRGSQRGVSPDTEILNRNNGQVVMLDNSFFRYEVKVQEQDPTNNPQIFNKTPQGWITYRIPIHSSQYRTIVGNPLFSNIQYVRVWWRGGRFSGQIADWQTVGSQWQRFRPLNPDGTSDTTLSIAYVSIEGNAGAPDYYTVPPGVVRPRVLGNPDPNLNLPQNEQALAISVRNLPPRQERMAIRFFRQFDIFFYRKMKFFLHGGGDVPDGVPSPEQPRVQAFIRFGVDSLNYYEYRMPLQRGWQDLAVDLPRLTAIKSFGRDTVVSADDGLGGQYQIVGTPTLTRIQFVGFGIRNAGLVSISNVTMWANELRLLEPDAQPDIAATLNIAAQLADVATITASYNRLNGYFHRLEERFGPRNTRQNFNFNAQTDVMRFLPGNTLLEGTMIPFAYTHTSSLEELRFIPQSDISVDAAAQFLGRARDTSALELTAARLREDSIRARSRTQITEDQFAFTGIRFNARDAGWFVRDILSQFVFNFTYAQREERSPVVRQRFRWTWVFNTAYNHTFAPAPFKPFAWTEGLPILGGLKDYTLFLTPSSLAFGLNLQRERQTEQLWLLNVPSPVIRNFAADQTLRFTWKIAENEILNPTLDYSLRTLSTLLPLEFDEAQRQRSGGDIFRSLFLQNGRLLNFGSDVRHEQNVTVNMRPRLPEFLGGRFLDLTSNYTALYAWQDLLVQVPGQADFGRGARVETTFRINGNLRLRDIGAALFGSASQPATLNNPFVPPSSADNASQQSAEQQRASLGEIIRTVLFDFERINITYSNQSANQQTGILGGNGVTNFWTRAPFGRAEGVEFGPFAGYQLGFLEHPHGTMQFVPSSQFPFFEIRQQPGLRAFNSFTPAQAVLPPDNLKRESTMDINATRQLWEGMSLTLNWNSRWTEVRSQSAQVNEVGEVFGFQNYVLTRAYNRSFVSIPSPFAALDNFFNTAQNVVNLYNARRGDVESEFAAFQRANPTDTSIALRRNAALLNVLSQAFRDGLETFGTFSILPEALRQVLPSLNWGLRWQGVERTIPSLGKLFRALSLDHRYVGSYQSTQREMDGVGVPSSDNPSGRGTVRESEQVDAAFQPLIGINAQFNDDAVGGALSGTLRYSTRTGYRLNSADRASIARETSNDFSLQATYLKRNVKLSLLDMDFESDLEMALQASYRQTLQSLVDIPGFEARAPNANTGRRLDGRTAVIIEPSARYVFSSRLSARAFFRYELNLSEGAAAPGSSVTQFGLDVRITLAGGR